MRGTRLSEDSSVSDLWSAKPGAYFLLPDRSAVWASVPTGDVIRIPVSGAEDPSWTMVEEEDGSITIDPSINLHPVEGVHGGWHGFLRAGEWTDA